MTRTYDLIVIGTGNAGQTCAWRCRKAGWSVAIVEERPVGGTCALRGCDPKKILVNAGQLYERIRTMTGTGVETEAARIDWPALMRFKRSIIDPKSERSEKALRDAGIDVIRGHARFLDERTVQAGDEKLTAERIVVAAGASPAPLGIEGEEHVATSDDFLELDELPRRIVFIGGGFISFEFAHVAIRAGARVSLLHRSEPPLKHFDPDLARILTEASREAGIDVRVNAPVKAVEREGKEFVVRFGENEAARADLVVHGAGRNPNVGGLDLEKAGIEYSRRGVAVNERLQSVSNPRVYAGGDAADTGRQALTPVANTEGYLIYRALMGRSAEDIRIEPAPMIVFTTPPLAAVGHTERSARAEGLKYRVNYEPDNTTKEYMRRNRVRWAAYKTLVEEETGRILGAHVLGPQADETINLFAMAMRWGVTARQFKQTTLGYPTFSSYARGMV